jgi:divalent metal cation (Fe/Co/Zn/Cd) transporter
LNRTATFQRAGQVVSQVVEAVRRVLPNADVTVNSVPRAAREENLFDRIRAVATRNNVNVHDISVQDLAGRLHVEQHLELDERLSLKQAHDQVTQLEAEMRGEVPELASILTHIESEPATIEPGEEPRTDHDLEQRVRRTIREFPEVLDVHELQVKRVRGKTYLALHATLPDSLSLARVHDIQTELEIRIKQAVPGLFRVLIHPEPATDNRR